MLVAAGNAAEARRVAASALHALRQGPFLEEASALLGLANLDQLHSWAPA